jgi:lysyl-tRNA synthetase class 2
VAYDSDRRRLQLVFRDGSAYTYFDVPPRIYFALLEAPSKGGYFNRNVRGQFGYERNQTALQNERFRVG